jgi:hypothetical protein
MHTAQPYLRIAKALFLYLLLPGNTPLVGVCQADSFLGRKPLASHQARMTDESVRQGVGLAIALR